MNNKDNKLHNNIPLFSVVIPVYNDEKYLLECVNSIMGDKNNTHTIPWEVYCLNETFKNNIWIAINPSSIVNGVVCFEKQEDVKYVMLNGCKEIINSEFTPLECFYRNIQIKYGDMLVLPKTIKDLDKILV